MTVFVFILAAIATYRASLMVVKESGPLEIFVKLRRVARFTKLLTCMFCTSIWIAGGIEAALYLSGFRDAPVVVLCLILAMSAVTIILDRCFTSDLQPTK